MVRNIAVVLLALLASAIVTNRVSASTVTLTNAAATFSQTSFDVSLAIDGNVTHNSPGWAISPNQGSNQQAVFQVFTPSVIAADDLLVFNLLQNFDAEILGDFRLSVTTDPVSSFGTDGLDDGTQDITHNNWTVLAPLSAISTGGATMNVQVDQSVFVNGTIPTLDDYIVTAQAPFSDVTGIRLEALTHTGLPDNGPGYASGNFVLTEFTVDAIAPEPASLGLLVMGGVVLLRRRRVG